MPDPSNNVVTSAQARSYGVSAPSLVLPTPAMNSAYEQLQEWSLFRYADSTIESRKRLWRRMEHWAREQGTVPSPNVAALWIASLPGLVPATLRGYASAIQAVGRTTMGWSDAPLHHLQAVLRSLPQKPVRQAFPASKQMAHSTISALLRAGELQGVAVAILLWKVAGRCGDVLRLRRCDVDIGEFGEGDSRLTILVDWQKAKCRRSGDAAFCETRISLLTGVWANELAGILRGLMQGPAGAPLFSLTRQRMVSLLKRHGDTRLTAHSFRRGALKHLLGLSVRGVAVEASDLHRFARHKAPVAVIPRVTLRYLSEERWALGMILSCRALTVLL